MMRPHTLSHLFSAFSTHRSAPLALSSLSSPTCSLLLKLALASFPPPPHSLSLSCSPPSRLIYSLHAGFPVETDASLKLLDDLRTRKRSALALPGIVR